MNGEEFKDDHRRSLSKALIGQLTRRSAWRASLAVLEDFAILAGAIALALTYWPNPVVIVPAVIIIGTVVVAVTIAEELDDYARTHRGNTEAEASSGRAKPVTEAASEEPEADPQPEPDGSSSGRDWFPPVSSDPSDRRPECTPRRVPPKGGHPFHDACADNVPLNAFIERPRARGSLLLTLVVLHQQSRHSGTERRLPCLQ